MSVVGGATPPGTSLALGERLCRRGTRRGDAARNVAPGLHNAAVVQGGGEFLEGLQPLLVRASANPRGQVGGAGD